MDDTQTSYSESWRANFRHPAFRKGQDSALESIAKNLDEKVKFTVAELPTGLGKSDIAIALSKSAPSSAFITTSQNILIDQYVRDFGNDPHFYLIKGKTHYDCKITRWGDCNKGSQNKCMYSKSHKRDEDADQNQSCTYKWERDQACRSKIALTNTTYFALACRNTMIWAPRSLAIVDEAHNLAGEVMSLTSMVITDRELERMRVARVIPKELVGRPEVDLDRFRVYLDKLNEELEWSIDQMKDQLTSDGKIIEDMEALMQKISWFNSSIEAGVEWIVDYDQDSRKNDRLTARPIDTAYFAQDLFFRTQADQYVLQSATIVDFKRYAEELGIEAGRKVVRPSPFDPARRPVYTMNVAQMTYKHIDQSLPEIAAAVERILNARPDKKGLVHTGSYKVQQYLEQMFGLNDRCLFPKSGEREDAIKEHFSSPRPTVLFSPSMTEGIDGRGDWLRFQIICKIPYPSLADRRVKIKAERSREWYNYQTAKTIIQAVGRGMRSEDDWCETYVLDSGFWGFARNANLPTDFTNCLQSADNGWKALSKSR